MRRLRDIALILLLIGFCIGLAIVLNDGLSSRDAKVESRSDKEELKKQGFSEIVPRKVYDNKKGDLQIFPGKASKEENFEEYQRLLADWEAERGKVEYWTSFYAPDYSVVIKRYKP